jgi:uncharacterized membrane protein
MRYRHLQEEARRELVEEQLERCKNPNLADIVERNIGTILSMRLKQDRSRRLQDKIADSITDFSGSMAFVYMHAALFALWILWNVGMIGLKPFDPYPFNFLTMTVSLEAIFLSTFVLVSQNRMGAAQDKRADLDLQINLLAEHEITKLLILNEAIAKKIGVDMEGYGDLTDLEQEVTPEVVLKEIADREALAKNMGHPQDK